MQSGLICSGGGGGSDDEWCGWSWCAWVCVCKLQSSRVFVLLINKAWWWCWWWIKDDARFCYLANDLNFFFLSCRANWGERTKASCRESVNEGCLSDSNVLSAGSLRIGIIGLLCLNSESKQATTETDCIFFLDKTETDWRETGLNLRHVWTHILEKKNSNFSIHSLHTTRFPKKIFFFRTKH